MLLINTTEAFQRELLKVHCTCRDTDNYLTEITSFIGDRVTSVTDEIN